MNIKKIVASGLTAGLLFATQNVDFAQAFDKTSSITVISREEGSGTRGAFVELFEVMGEIKGKKADLTTLDAQITNSTSVMMTTISGDEYAIGYTSLGALNDSVKAVKINNAEATVANIQSGQYPVSRPFNIATLGDVQNQTAKDFINFILSTEGQKIVSQAGYIPLNNTKAYQANKVQGKAIVGGSSSVAPVMEKLAEAYKKVNPQAEIELQVNDSTTGMMSTINKTYDIGLASRGLKEQEIKQGLKATVIATDGIAVIINKSNPIENLTTTQVKEIYLGNTTSWDMVSK